MLDFPPIFLQDVELVWSLADVAAVQRFPAGIAKIVPAVAGHVRTAFSLLDDLPALRTLTILFTHLEIDSHEDLAFSDMRELEALFAVGEGADAAGRFGCTYVDQS